MKNNLIVSLDEKIYNSNNASILFDELVEKIEEVLDAINNGIDQLDIDNDAKQEKIDKLLDPIKALKEHKSIYEQKDNIKDCIDIGKKIEMLENKLNKISTRTLSSLSQDAHSYLLTENLKSKFEEELKKLVSVVIM